MAIYCCGLLFWNSQTQKAYLYRNFGWNSFRVSKASKANYYNSAATLNKPIESRAHLHQFPQSRSSDDRGARSNRSTTRALVLHPWEIKYQTR
jgi:hypothetical protein